MTAGAYRHPRNQSESSSPGNAASGPSNFGPPLSTSSYGSGLPAQDESDEEDTITKRSSRRKRSVIVPGGMWEWAARKPKSKKEPPKRAGGADSGPESNNPDKQSPERESDHDDKPDEIPGPDGAMDEDEDVKPDIAALSNGAPILDGSADASTRTSPGLPLATLQASRARSNSELANASLHRRSASGVSTKQITKVIENEDADAMEVDPPAIQDTTNGTAAPATGLDVLAQFASVVDGSTAPVVNGNLDGPEEHAAVSEAGDEPGDEDPEDAVDPHDADLDDAPENASEEEAATPIPKGRKGKSKPVKATLLPPPEDKDDDADDAEAALEQTKDADSDQESAAETPAQDVDQSAQEAEAEQEIENEIQPMQRVEALEILAGMELKFALLRERIYQDKMRDIACEEKLLFEGVSTSICHAFSVIEVVAGNHPEYMYLLAELQRRKDRKLELAALRMEHEKQFASQKRKVDENATWAAWTEAKEEVRDDLVADLNSKRRRLERERRNLDANKLRESEIKTARSITILDCNPVMSPPTMPSPRYLSPPSPHSLKRTIKLHTSRYATEPSDEQTISLPVLAPLSQDELASDLEAITGRSRRQAPPLQSGARGYPPGSHPVPMQGPYPPQPQYGPPAGYGQGPQPVVVYGQPPPAPRYGPPIGYGHPDPNGAYPYQQQHTPPTFDPNYDPYGMGAPPLPPPPQHYVGGPPGQAPYPSPQHHAYPAPAHPQLPPAQLQTYAPPPIPQGLHQPQPQYHAYRPPSPPNHPPPQSRGNWRSSASDGANGAPKDKTVIDLTRGSPEPEMRTADSGPSAHMPPPRSSIPTPRPTSSHVKQEERPASSAGRLHERLPSLASQVPLPQPDPRASPLVQQQYPSSVTPRPPSTLPPLPSMPLNSSRASQLPPFSSPPASILGASPYGGATGQPPRSTATPLGSLISRHSQSPTVPKRSATPLGLPPFGPVPPPPLSNVAPDRV